MRHENRRLLLFSKNRRHIITDRQPRLKIECGKRLIEQQKLRVGRQRPDQRRSLAHPAGKLRRMGISEAPEPIIAQHLLDPRLCLFIKPVLDLQT